VVLETGAWAPGVYVVEGVGAGRVRLAVGGR
jgi:hypothetical protein